MSRNSYDLDITTWSPEGKILQLEYANEATKHGSCCLGIRGNDLVILAALRRYTSELAEMGSKIDKVTDYVAVTFSGITNDAKYLRKQMRHIDLAFQFNFSKRAPMKYIMNDLTLISQRNTISYDRRPFGVSLLVAGYDSFGPHIFATFPSGEYEELEACAIGARSQSSKTYLEKNKDLFRNGSKRELMIHAIKALRTTIKEEDLAVSGDRIEMCVIEKDKPLAFIDTQEIKSLYESISEDL